MKKYMVVIVLFIIFICTGCKPEEEVVQPQNQQEIVDWKANGFVVNGGLEEKQELFIQEYIPWNHEEVVYDEETEMLMAEALAMPWTEVGAYDGKIYRLNSVSEVQYIKEKRWILEIFDTTAMQTSLKEFSFEELGIGEDRENMGFLVGMDVISEGKYVFQWKELEKKEDKFYQKVNRFIYSDLAGAVEAVDVLEVYGAVGIEPERPSSVLTLPVGYCVCDGQGNTYVLRGKYEGIANELYVFDKQGAVILRYIGPESQRIEDFMRTPQGELIYLVFDEETRGYSLIFPNAETGEVKLLAQLKDERVFIKQLFGMQGNQIYYETTEGIVRWDVASGNRTLVFNYKENGITAFFSTMLVLREGKEPLLRLYQSTEDGLEDWLVPLSETEVFQEKSIEIVDLVQGNSKDELALITASIARKNMGEMYNYKSAGGKQDDYKAQIWAQLVNGEGPDILYVSRSDMKMLYEKQALLNLEEIISQEVLDDLLPGALDLGTQEGELVALPVCVRAEGLAIPKKVYEKEYWDLDTMLNLIEAGKLEGGIYYPALQCYYAPLGAVNGILRNTLGTSGLIDWEGGKSYFEDERFYRLLSCMQEQLPKPEGGENWFAGGNRIVEIILGGRGTIYDFGVMVENGEAHYIGYPTNGNCGNYLRTEGVFVVNKNTKNKELVQKYMEELLSKEMQEVIETDGSLGIYKLTTEEIVYDEEGRAWWKGQELAVFKDGTTSLHRAKAFLESCVGAPMDYPELDVILFEELSAWAAEKKDPKTAASIIDSRIQVYLDER